jgi:predicted nucleic acid-binding Zn ribbon protein
MAAFTYRCAYCKDETEVQHSVGTAAPKLLDGDNGCDICGGPRRRVFDWAGGTKLKGTGWAGKPQRPGFERRRR